MNSFSTSFTVEQTPQEVFDAINNVRKWWMGEIEGDTDKVGAEFTYVHPNVHYSKQKVSELIPGKKVVWLVVDSKLDFVQDKSEWTNTEITFDIAEKGDKTEVRFTHVGLVPEYQCFDSCSNAWVYYVNSSLRNLILALNGQLDKQESSPRVDTAL